MFVREETYSVLLFNVFRILLDCTGLSEVMFTTWVTVHLFAIAIFNKNLKKLEPVYVVSSVFFPLVIALLMLTTMFTTTAKNPSLTKPTAIEEIIITTLSGACVIITFLSVIILVVILCCRAYRKKAGIPSQLSQQHRIALYEMMPILSFPILFLILAIPVFVYVVCANLSISGDSLTAVSISYVIVAPCWGITAALSLTIHVGVILCIRKCKNASIHNKKELKKTGSYGTVNESLLLLPTLKWQTFLYVSWFRIIMLIVIFLDHKRIFAFNGLKYRKCDIFI